MELELYDIGVKYMEEGLFNREEFNYVFKEWCDTFRDIPGICDKCSTFLLSRYNNFINDLSDQSIEGLINIIMTDNNEQLCKVDKIFYYNYLDESERKQFCNKCNKHIKDLHTYKENEST